MAKLTGKLQITIPKHLAELHGLTVGDEVDFVSDGDRIVLVPRHLKCNELGVDERLRLFDLDTQSQRALDKSCNLPSATSRGWTREDLYNRDRDR